MAAKKKETYRVTADFSSLTEAHDVAEMLSVESVQIVTTYVCPHCDEPWPMHDGRPLSREEYIGWACGQQGTKYDYCCDATRLECEASND